MVSGIRVARSSHRKARRVSLSMYDTARRCGRPSVVMAQPSRAGSPSQRGWHVDHRADGHQPAVMARCPCPVGPSRPPSTRSRDLIAPSATVRDVPLPRALGRFNGRVTNPILWPLVRHLPGFGALEHRGRRTDRPYRTTLLAFRRGDRLTFAATYGPTADWIQNVLAAGEGDVRGGRHQVAPHRASPLPRLGAASGALVRPAAADPARRSRLPRGARRTRRGAGRWALHCAALG